MSQGGVTVNTMQQLHKHASDARTEDECRRIEEALHRLQGQAASLDGDELRRLAKSVGRMEARVASLKLSIARRITRAEGQAEAAAALRDGMRMTQREAKQVTGAARKLEEMPNTRAKLESGEITFHHALSLAEAARECGARTVDRDAGLLQGAADEDPDKFRRQTKQWADDHSPDRGEAELLRQRARRRAHAFWDPEAGMGIVRAELDRIRFSQVRQALDLRAESLRRADSGGENHPDDIRTGDQRRADALFELLTGRDADTLAVREEATGKAVTQLIITAEIGNVDGTDPAGKCEILGAGPAPPDILRHLSPDVRLRGAIFDRKGLPLWLGRSQRLGNAAQRLAAALRDRGCVLCEAPVHLTELHHIREWHNGGGTDIDNLVSLCGPHHRHLQDHDLQLVKIGNKWQTRPRTGHPAPPRPPPAHPPTRKIPAGIAGRRGID